ncbi:hypothetical protein NLJ89_g10931 [Agrocybe chaxingu]|uniref:Uncharacterized protein n=1 Tax=Agrocybe chaxingu TaxID=84603 RepID=A0A9W8MRM7_9AGAR|nr:hypothetical protein NLJ89_g10931 [Agrocybe chaxingu]
MQVRSNNDMHQKQPNDGSFNSEGSRVHCAAPYCEPLYEHTTLGTPEGKPRIELAVDADQSPNVLQAANWLTAYEVMRGGEPEAWRLTTENAEDASGREEVVATMQGILFKKDLPPFTNKISQRGAYARYLRQSVTLVGFDTPSFNSAVHAITQIHGLFARSVGTENLEQCGMVSHSEDHSCVETSNRYFTPKKDVTSCTSIQFSPDVDPHGYLAEAAGPNLFHGEDNEVYYYERTIDRSGKDYKFIPTRPGKFQVGDIVEVQTSFIAVPLRDNKFKTSMILRSITLLEGRHTQDAAAAKVSQLLMHPRSQVKVFRRRVGYGDEEMAIARAKMTRMDIDEHEDSHHDNENIEDTSVSSKSDDTNLD